MGCLTLGWSLHATHKNVFKEQAPEEEVLVVSDQAMRYEGLT